MPILYKNYPKNWKTEIRPAVLERANNCCEVCGVQNRDIIFRGFYNEVEVFQRANGELFKVDGSFIMNDSEYCCIEPSTGKENQKAIKVVLTIAHLNHDTTDNRMENLKALCQLHHLRHDHTHHQKNAKETRTKKKKLQTLFQ